MPTVTLIRHAMPHVDPTTDPAQWHLTDHARTQAAALALPSGPRHHVASDEAKAIETLRELTTGPITADARFGEVHRPRARDGHTHRTLAAAYLAGTTHPGWEPRDHVAARFAAAIADHLATAGTAHLIVATHGMAMTIWLATITDMPDPVAYWRALAFPDVITAALPAHWHPRPPATT
ncbi:histidine phosphatase family protein [Phytomonospora sp. NPDC050363]|uniref:histidine phosphatase family protein n=1 Tax=Phytomonospora sp. NPDC050363 TaxID=3155642 RepID=UPI00340D0D66